MSWVKDEYVLSYNGKNVAWYYIFDNHTYDYTVSSWESDLKDCKELLAQRGLLKNIEDAKKPVAALEAMMTEENRVKGKKKAIYVDGPFTLTRIPQETGDRFLVYRCGAKKEENGYSEKDHSAPHYEGPKTPEGMREWTTWYAFEAMDDGTFVAALDESWWWGGGHNDGGTIRTEIPEEWFELPYDEFLDNVLSLSAARHYGFTVEELKAKKGLKEFFGFK
ncbi:MAG: hypothetical protein IKU00_06495 [Bacteroidales bacterium]|nr:hypothetical protein [Bacteroidales bacterium]